MQIRKYIMGLLVLAFLVPMLNACVSSPKTAWTPDQYKKKDFSPRHRQKPAKFGIKRLMWRDI